MEQLIDILKKKVSESKEIYEKYKDGGHGFSDRDYLDGKIFGLEYALDLLRYEIRGEEED